MITRNYELPAPPGSAGHTSPRWIDLSPLNELTRFPSP